MIIHLVIDLSLAIITWWASMILCNVAMDKHHFARLITTRFKEIVKKNIKNKRNIKNKI